VPQREVLEHEGALGPDTTEEAGEDEGDHAGHHRSGRRPFNVDEADGISRRHTRQGARTHRVYDRAQTPYQRLGAAGALSAESRRELETLYQSLNPLQLHRALERELDRLWTLAASDPRRPGGNTEIATPLPTSPPGGS
jgi:hypothetical protein